MISFQKPPITSVKLSTLMNMHEQNLTLFVLVAIHCSGLSWKPFQIVSILRLRFLLVVIICCSHAVPNTRRVRYTLKIMKKTTKDANSHILVLTGQLAPSHDVYIYMQVFQEKKKSLKRNFISILLGDESVPSVCRKRLPLAVHVFLK